jgi:GntR family transcriptional regulator/MocR family aminotransferase
LAPYRISCEGRPGLIFGYATLDERAFAEGIEILAEAISDVRSRQPER